MVTEKSLCFDCAKWKALSVRLRDKEAKAVRRLCSVAGVKEFKGVRAYDTRTEIQFEPVLIRGKVNEFNIFCGGVFKDTVKIKPIEPPAEIEEHWFEVALRQKTESSFEIP